MKILIVVFCLSFLLLGGCVSQSTYDTLQAERDNLQTENQELNQTTLELQQRLEVSQQELSSLQEAYDKISAPREFRDVAELELWLSLDDTDKLEFVEDTQDCDDYARILMLNAFQDGYILGFYALQDHAMNICFIGDEIWLIFPQLDDFWFMGYTWE